VVNRWLARQTVSEVRSFRIPPLSVPRGEVKILFVCTGNICRSPTAAGVMRKFVQEAGLQHLVVIDSAGTHDYCAGEPPHPKAQDVARRRGYDLASMRARQLVAADFEAFDLVLAMDRSNLALLHCICPHQHRAKIHLLMHYARESAMSVIPDPYGRKHADFEMVLDCIEDACSGLLSALSQGNSVSMQH